LAYCAESDIADYAAARQFPVMPCNLCGSQENLQRQNIKAMLVEWDRLHPGRVENTFRALTDVRPSQLADRNLFGFQQLGARGAALAAKDWLAGDGQDQTTTVPTPASISTGLEVLEA
jgi:tRNA 2-thiocytidine biosynthesis protein TtcA